MLVTNFDNLIHEVSALDNNKYMTRTICGQCTACHGLRHELVHVLQEASQARCCHMRRLHAL